MEPGRLALRRFFGYLSKVFAHLHCHSWFSLGQGPSSPQSLLEAASRRGITALACTDTNGVYGSVEFQSLAQEAGIQPILGAHLVQGEEECVALAATEAGWAALCRAITWIHWNGGEQSTVNSKREQPASRLADRIATDREGLLVLSASVPLLERVVERSGPVDLFAELRPGRQRHGVLEVARRLGIAPVATSAVMFANPEDWPRHRLLHAISRNTSLSALEHASRSPHERTGPSPPDAWLKPAAEIARHFPDCPDAVTRTGELAERCRYRIPVGARVLPPRLAELTDAMARLRAMAYAGAGRRYGTIAPVTRDRLEHELAIIAQKGFADYFLVVKDIVEHGPTHCGRGSVANSIVSYALGITHVDPLAAGLLFERFLNPERRDPPDIDLDFPWDERDRVLAYVFRRYPMPRAAMVANHNTFKLRGALREVAKVHGRPPGEIREITRRLPGYSDAIPIDHLLAEHPNFTGLDLPASWLALAREATPLVGTPRHLSLHPGGVVIVPSALTDYVPVEPAVKRLEGAPDLTVPVIQFEKDGAEDAGLVKIDLLGNRSLAVIRDGIAAVRANTGVALDYSSSDAGDDSATRELFRTGRTMGVFYTESPASRLLCEKSRSETFDILVLNTSIIRPASNKYIRVYLERLHGGAWEPLDPSLRDVLAETFGVMVYQEDVVNVSAVFAGMPLAAGDGLRKALSKKRPVKALASYAQEFFAGALALGRDPEVTRRVWENVLSFSGYSFCKGHSCSYIQVAQQSCYLRANYPAEFFAAVLANGGGFYAPFAYVAEAMRLGLRILPPDVNASEHRTTGRDGAIRVGLQFVKGLSSEAVDSILAGREGGGAVGWIPPHNRPAAPLPHRPYRSLADFRARTGLKPDDLRLLIKVGALDGIAGGLTRPQLLWLVDSGVEGRRGEGAELPLHSHTTLPHRPSAPPPLPEYTAARRRETECQLLGFSTDCHPMSLWAERLRPFRPVRSTALRTRVGEHILCAGMLTTAKPVQTRNEEPMQFATFDDGDGLIETVLFPEVHRTRGHVLFDQGPFLLRGKVEVEFGAVTLTVTHLDRVERKKAVSKSEELTAKSEG